MPAKELPTQHFTKKPNIPENQMLQKGENEVMHG